MPNWCEGTLKVRGKEKDLKRFVLEGLRPVSFFGEYQEKLQFDGSMIESKIDCHIENTRRGFVENLYEWFDKEDDEIDIICLETRFAWGIEASKLLETCKKYNVDMRIYAFEQGMEFNQNIEIINGQIIKDEEIKFGDYRWECICPNMGG